MGVTQNYVVARSSWCSDTSARGCHTCAKVNSDSVGWKPPDCPKVELAFRRDLALCHCAMEASLYGDQDYTATYPTYNSMDSVQQLKKRMTLELDVRPNKRQRMGPLLTSPDVNMLKLASPELERFITQHGLTTTPTPGAQTLGAVFNRGVTEEQENYARGFVDALHHLKQQEQLGNVVYSSETSEFAPSEPAPVYTQLETSTATNLHTAVTSTAASALPGQQYYGGVYEPLQIKEEPQTVPVCGSPVTDQSSSQSQPPSPVDMAQQERIKLERKRLRNRIAATKCRRRKLERIARLEERVAQIKSENSELAAVAARLRDQVLDLKKEVQQHAQNGCQIVPPA